MTTQALAPPPPEPHTAGRWAGTLLAAAVYAPRVYYVQGFYVVSYGLSIYRLNLLIGFLSPMVDPELEALDQAGPALPTCGNNEFKPFIRRLPEFKFWCEEEPVAETASAQMLQPITMLIRTKKSEEA
ncbi:protein RER1A-like isoform X4 [Triticum urartu]|uniref:protein RER1A-like isoform X4 n=1 Tax=Triticum urartu TaxID=4572 RepID=UPI0020433D1C|nr:protein RER1A-like isoform X4 [Triticum urartu]